ncbi:MAG: hypothetical protein IPP14_00380 [Planctomycetes bacterium]|nr:hypothetical protein [Planctomycetota bacterium]
MPDYNLNDWQAVERAERNVAQWLAERRGGEVRGHLLAASVLFPLSLIAAVGIAIGFGFVGMIMGAYIFAFLAAAVVVVVAYPVQYLRWRKGLTRVSLHGGGLTVDDDVPPTTLLIRTGESADNDWDVGDTLLFPATIAGMGLQHVSAAIQLSKADLGLIAKVLTALAHSDRRTSLYDLELVVADARLPAALRALRHWPGVVWHVRDQVALAVNDELRSEIARQGGWRT